MNLDDGHQGMEMPDNYLILENAQFEIRHMEGEHRFAQEAFWKTVDPRTGSHGGRAPQP
ncbi:MAG: hypothetical protein NTV22_12715 [bacterium]|nr:hypothetical protein [bacterium]